MKAEEIERLLARFYQGITDELEEKRLQDAFRDDDCLPEHLQREKRLFLALTTAGTGEEEEASLPEGLEKRLAQAIDVKAEEERLFFWRNRTRCNWRWLGSIAASLLLLLGIGYVVFERSNRLYEPKDTFTDPRQAYEVLQATLMEISTHLNEGIAQVEATQKDLTLANQEIRNELIKR